MNTKKITEINFRYAMSEKTHPTPYKDSRPYRREKPMVLINTPTPNVVDEVNEQQQTITQEQSKTLIKKMGK